MADQPGGRRRGRSPRRSSRSRTRRSRKRPRPCADRQPSRSRRRDRRRGRGDGPRRPRGDRVRHSPPTGRSTSGSVTIDPAAPDLHSQILTEHPEVADRVCGAAVAVDAAQAQAVRDHLAGGGILDGLDPAVPTLARTAPGGDCLTRGSFPRQIVNLLYGTPVGSSGEQEVVSRSTGTPAVFIAVPAARDQVTGGEADAATQLTLQRLHDEGGAAFSELAFSTVDPALDSRVGTMGPGASASLPPMPHSASARSRCRRRRPRPPPPSRPRRRPPRPRQPPRRRRSRASSSTKRNRSSPAPAPETRAPAT